LAITAKSSDIYYMKTITYTPDQIEVLDLQAEEIYFEHLAQAVVETPADQFEKMVETLGYCEVRRMINERAKQIAEEVRGKIHV
jgi:hypothetical protein